MGIMCNRLNGSIAHELGYTTGAHHESPHHSNAIKEKQRVLIPPILFKAEGVHAQKGLALPRASHSGEIALAGLYRLRSTLTAAPVLFAHAVVTETEIGRNTQP
jgi:hypothetical protein